MVPFPEIDGDPHYTQNKVAHAKVTLREVPDFHGILTPPMREEVKKASW